MSVPSVEDLFELEAPDSDAVVEARLSLLGAAVGSPQRLGRFTDEELVALDDPGSAPLAPSPWYSSLSDDEQETALTAALRGLTARGVYRATPVDAKAGTFTFQASVEILALLTMRRHTGTVVVAERRTADERDWALLYQQRAGLWLAEYVTHVGQHEFALATDDESAEAVTTWCGALAGSVAPDLDVVFTRQQVADQDAALEPVGRSTAAVTITRLEVGESVVETWSGVFTGPEGSYVSTAVGDDVGYRGASRDAVLAHWRSVLGAA
jgi:hypothetical protein